MSQVKIQGNASGTGVFTVAAPNSSTNRTLTLPDNTGTLLSSATAGTVLQVVSTTKLDSFTTTSTSMVDITGMSVSITPTSATSKILVMVSLIVSGDSWNSVGSMFNLVRNATNLSVGTSGATANATMMCNTYAGSQGDTSNNYTSNAITYLDSPATTSSTTYKIQGRVITGSGILAINQRSSGTLYGGSSTITVMEIAA